MGKSLKVTRNTSGKKDRLVIKAGSQRYTYNSHNNTKYIHLKILHPKDKLAH